MALLVVFLLVGGVVLTPLLGVLVGIGKYLKSVLNPNMINATVSPEIANTTEYKTAKIMVNQLSSLLSTILNILSDPRALAALLAAGAIYAAWESSRTPHVQTI